MLRMLRSNTVPHMLTPINGNKQHCRSDVRASNSKLKTNFALRYCEFQLECPGNFAWNGRYLFYTYEWVGPTWSAGTGGVLLDMKTGATTFKKDDYPYDGHGSAWCANRECNPRVYGSAIGRGSSYVLGYSVTGGVDVPGATDTNVIETYCFSRDLKSGTRKVIAHPARINDLRTVRIVGPTVRWTESGVSQSAALC